MDIIWGSMPPFSDRPFFCLPIIFLVISLYHIPTKDLPRSHWIPMFNAGFLIFPTGQLVKRRAARSACGCGRPPPHPLRSIPRGSPHPVSREQPAETMVLPMKCGENVGKWWTNLAKSGNIVINMESIWINMGPCGFLSSTNPISLGHPTLLGSICFVGDPEKRKQNKSNKRTIVSPIRGR